MEQQLPEEWNYDLESATYIKQIRVENQYYNLLIMKSIINDKNWTGIYNGTILIPDAKSPFECALLLLNAISSMILEPLITKLSNMSLNIALLPVKQGLMEIIKK